MAVSAQLVKQLRETTGAGILDCKKALEETDGDMAKAVEVLQKRNMAVALKKINRDAKDGQVAVFLDPNAQLGVLAEINSETDFVGRSDGFVKFVAEVCSHVAKAAPADVESMMSQAWTHDAGLTVQDALTAMVGRCGENIKIRRFVRFEASQGRVGAYVHGEGRIGVLVDVSADKPGLADTDEFKALVKEMYLQITAMSPLVVGREDLPADVVEKQKEIAAAQLGDISKKPKEIQDKILEGKLGKWYAEVCLLDQVYIRDDTKKVRDVVAEAGRKLGATLTVRRFARYGLGEGL